MKHFTPHQKLASDLISSGGLIISPTLETGYMANFKRVLMTFKRSYLDVSEKNKREVLRMMHLYLMQLNLQVISKIENGAELLEGTDLLHVVTKDLLAMLKDYYDSVRD